MTSTRQWGGRFSAAPEMALLEFGSSLQDDLILAPFDVRCSQAHVAALRDGGVLSYKSAHELAAALDRVAVEIDEGSFATYAQKTRAEDVHGAIDARVRELLPDIGEMLHAGRSRNDQVATTLLLYCADRAARGKKIALDIALHFVSRAGEELKAGTLLAATTHWQPAQPVLLAFWLAAAAEPLVRDARRFTRAASDAMQFCPLGSGAVAGSSLPLKLASAATTLGFEAPARNAMDAIGNRDAALDVAHACVRAVAHVSRMCEELIIWCTPAFGYARLADPASTGSSLMPQKRNPDPFELVRATASELTGRFAGAVATTNGLALSYHRDLQITKAGIIGVVEIALSALDAFLLAFTHVEFARERMSRMAGTGLTVATDIADAMILRGVSASKAHAAVGECIIAHEQDGAPLDWPDVRASVESKRTAGSTHPRIVSRALEELQAAIEQLAR